MIRRWRVSKRGFLRIPLDKPFEEAYFTHRMWMFFRETKETEEDIRRMFHQVREKMRQRITLKKKSDPGKFVIPCLIGGIDYPSALCDTGSSVSILPMVTPIKMKKEQVRSDLEGESYEDGMKSG